MVTSLLLEPSTYSPLDRQTDSDQIHLNTVKRESISPLGDSDLGAGEGDDLVDALPLDAQHGPHQIVRHRQLDDGVGRQRLRAGRVHCKKQKQTSGPDDYLQLNYIEF